MPTAALIIADLNPRFRYDSSLQVKVCMHGPLMCSVAFPDTSPPPRPQIKAEYGIIPNRRRGFLFQAVLVEKEGSPYFRILKNKCEEDDYEVF
jgi:hypothetical protein